MSTLLFVVSAASSYRLLLCVARHLADRGHRVVFLYERGRDALFDTIARDAAALGGEAHSLEARTDLQHQSGPAWRRHPHPGRAAVMWISVKALLAVRRTAPELERLRKLRAILASQLAASAALLAAVRPSVIVAGEDGISAPLAIHAAARHSGIRVVVVPYGNGTRRDLETALDVKAAHGGVITATGRWARLIARCAPQWIKTGAHAGALIYEEDYIVAAESLGITVRDPWIIHGGYGGQLCVESEQMRRAYLDDGIPPEKMVATGTPYCDVMVRAVADQREASAALRQPRRIKHGETRILVSWPPSYHDERGAQSEFASYREMSIAVLGWLSRLPGCSVTVSLHPATLAEDRAALIEAGVRLSDDYVIELIPAHDVFVTYFSSTIRWAVAAGKPVVNFDVYQLGLTVYATAPGVRSTSSFADFQREVLRLTASDYAFAEAAGQQLEVAADWGTLDGLNTARVAATITG